MTWQNIEGEDWWVAHCDQSGCGTTSTRPVTEGWLAPFSVGALISTTHYCPDHAAMNSPQAPPR